TRSCHVAAGTSLILRRPASHLRTSPSLVITIDSDDHGTIAQRHDRREVTHAVNRARAGEGHAGRAAPVEGCGPSRAAESLRLRPGTRARAADGRRSAAAGLMVVTRTSRATTRANAEPAQD